MWAHFSSLYSQICLQSRGSCEGIVEAKVWGGAGPDLRGSSRKYTGQQAAVPQEEDRDVEVRWN